MVIAFIWGIIVGAVSGEAATFYWAYREGKKRNDEEVKEEPEPKPAEQNPLDITPELAAGAYNVLREYCKKQVGCEFGCPFREKICHESFYEEPDVWPELEVPDVQKQ